MNGPQKNNTLEAALVLVSISDIPKSGCNKPPKMSSTAFTQMESSRQVTNNGSMTKEKTFFPTFMMEIISNPSNTDIICWLPQGYAFKIVDSERLNREIQPKLHLGKKTIESELSRWGFELVTNKPKGSVYYHKFFLRDSPNLCKSMKINILTTKPKFAEALSLHKKQNKKVPYSQNMENIHVEKNVPPSSKSSVCSLKAVSPSDDVIMSTSEPQDQQKDTNNEAVNRNILEQQKLLHAYFFERRRANNESLKILARQFEPGSRLDEMNKSIHSFRANHNMIISRSIDALLRPQSN